MLSERSLDDVSDLPRLGVFGNAISELFASVVDTNYVTKSMVLGSGARRNHVSVQFVAVIEMTTGLCESSKAKEIDEECC